MSKSTIRYAGFLAIALGVPLLVTKYQHLYDRVRVKTKAKKKEPRVYVCSCGNELISLNGAYPTDVACENNLCGQKDHWAAENEIVD